MDEDEQKGGVVLAIVAVFVGLAIVAAVVLS